MTKEPTITLAPKKQLCLMTFLIGLMTATAFFIPFIATGKGYFIFFGDFNVQQIPFYQYCHEMVRSGSFGWSWQTDLGSDFISSYSFYLLGSPFFWLTLPFPNSFVPYLMGPLLILKFACASLTAYMFIRRFTARAETAMIGGLIYAFSGFSVYNIFFNHFHEAIVFFPLLLLAMEVFMAEKQRGALIAAVFICALTNYFFFFGMVVFAIIYWAVRMFSKSFKFNFLEFLLMLFECVLGLLLAAAILVPSIITVMQNERVDSYIAGWSSVLYGKEQIFLNIIQCFFFPPDLPARPVFFPGADVKWSSLGGWLPLFSMTGVVTFLLSEKKGSWLRRIIVILTFMALVPGFNAAFYMFNTSYYARWFYMPILMMALATAISIEDTKVNWKAAFNWTLGITLGFIVVIGLWPQDIKNGKVTGFGLYTDAATNPIKYIVESIRHLLDKTYRVSGDFYDLRFWTTCIISILSLLILRALIPAIIQKKTVVLKQLIALVCVVSVLYSAFFIACGQTHSYDIDGVMINNLIKGEVNLPKDDDEFIRIDVYDGVDNTGLYLGQSSINFFHSIVPSSVTKFYQHIGEERSVASRPGVDSSAIRPLLSVKYLLDPIIDNSKEFLEDGETAMAGYTYLKTENGYKIYENNNYIPMGFTYEYYIAADDADYFKEYGNGKIDDIMLKAMIINKKDADIVSKYLTNLNSAFNIGDYDEEKDYLDFSDEGIAESCAALSKTAASSFKYDSYGFTAKITLEKENLVFFSVPFSEGWTAYVNGQKTDIITANIGFMAVKANQGENSIVFKYQTPGLKLGIYITIIAAFVSALYLSIVMIKRHYKPATEAEYPEGERIAEHIALYEAANYEAEHPENEHLLDDIDRNKIDAYQGVAGGFKFDESVLEEIKTIKEEQSKNPSDN